MRLARFTVVALAAAVLAAQPSPARASGLLDRPRAELPTVFGGLRLDDGAAAGTRWHLRELRTISSSDRADDAAPPAVGLESWFYGCTSRTIVTSSTDPAMVGWEFGGILSPAGFVGYLYDPAADVVYVGDRWLERGMGGPWDTCGLGLRGYVLKVPGGQSYLVRHGVPLADPPDPALIDPRLAHPGARVREVLPGTMNGIYRRALHVRPMRLGP